MCEDPPEMPSSAVDLGAASKQAREVVKRTRSDAHKQARTPVCHIRSPLHACNMGLVTANTPHGQDACFEARLCTSGVKPYLCRRHPYPRSGWWGQPLGSGPSVSHCFENPSHGCVSLDPPSSVVCPHHVSPAQASTGWNGSSAWPSGGTSRTPWRAGCVCSRC